MNEFQRTALVQAEHEDQQRAALAILKYAVYWDNGAEACGTFDQRFDTEQEAEAFATDWMTEMNAMDGKTLEDVDDCGGEGCYTAEVIEVEENPDTEGEGWDPIGELRAAGLDHRGRP